MNGCGPWYMPQWAQDEYYINQCNIHDSDYENKEYTRSRVDREFLERMLATPYKPTRRVQAYAYYGLVRAFGWISWGKK